ncbi:hypothetical protein C6P45_004724 [Maudiozyma exigua]|uniref:Uncharacterized protein n=1 Tax=Maudiozyma exigua TaxID=34358 RepID=A0A9P6WCT5_MAUEX|nr:hypothetical protein C6P45_004724 [Kazachstania exigua]
MSNVIGEPVDEAFILARSQILLRKFTNKVGNYLGNYRRNNICYVAAFLTLEFSNNQIWVQQYAFNNPDRHTQRNYFCEMIANETEYIFPYFNITVVDLPPSETGEAENRSEFFETISQIIIYDELLSYRGLSFEAKYVCREEYWKKEKICKNSFDTETPYVDSIPEKDISPNLSLKSMELKLLELTKYFGRCININSLFFQ